MREVELKARVQDLDELERKLIELGAYRDGVKEQSDAVYVRNVGSLEIFLSNDAFLRIREQGGETLFTYKYHDDGKRGDNKLSMPIEHETEISSKEELESMLAHMGFVKGLAIAKKRTSYRLGGYEICLDSVDDLGDFIELEKLLSHEDDVESVLEDMKAFLSKLGIAESDIGVDRYDIALLKKQFGSI